MKIVTRNGQTSVQFQTGLPWSGRGLTGRQCLRVRATIPQPGLTNTKRETFVKTGQFMEILGEAQRRFPGCALSVTTLGPKEEETK